MRVSTTVLTNVLATCAAVLVLASCGTPDDGRTPSPSPSPSIDIASGTASPAHSRLVGPSEFATAVAEPTRLTINVHVPYEGDIPGTDVSLPFDQIAQQAARLPTERSTPLAIYCRSGPMSAIAAAELSALGYTDVVELRGGMRAWQKSGRPLTKS